MALIKCAECGGTVSTTAATCPHCGAPQSGTQTADSSPRASPSQGDPAAARPQAPTPPAGTQNKRRWPAWIAAFIGLVVVINWIGSPQPPPPRTPTAASTPKPPPPLELLAAEFDKQFAEKHWGEARARLALLQKHYAGAEPTKKAAEKLPILLKEIAAENARNKAAAEARMKNAFAGLRKDRDDIQKVTFYAAPELPMNGVANYWGLYLAAHDSGAVGIRFKFMYTADDWLFINRMTLNIDGATLPTAVLGHFDVNRDNNGGRIWEWKDEAVDAKLLPLFDRVAASKKTVVRFEGQQYYKDRTITENEKRALRRILKAYRDRIGITGSG